jgi:DNA-nicking Smr family endonuclease
MRGSKAGFGDLKRLRDQLQARRESEAPPSRQDAAGSRSPKEGRPRQIGPADAKMPSRRDGAARLSPAEKAVPSRAVPPSSSESGDDLQVFRQAMRAVTPLRGGNRVVHAGRPVAADMHVQRRAAALGETARRADAGVSDGDVTHLLSEGGTAYVRGDAAPDTARKLRRGQWRAGAELDLHGLRVEQARHAVLSFIDECLEHGIRCVRVVHGKGYGSEGLTPVLKDKARTWLVQKKEVIAFSEASEREGGAGALIVLLSQAEEARH